MNSLYAGWLATGDGTVKRPSCSSAARLSCVPSAVVGSALDTLSGRESVSRSNRVILKVAWLLEFTTHEPSIAEIFCHDSSPVPVVALADWPNRSLVSRRWEFR